MIWQRAWAVVVSLVGIVACVASFAAGSSDTSGSADAGSEYERAVERIETGDYEDAIRILDRLNREESGNADVLNMLGFAHRKLSRMEPAFEFYQEALAIDPRHLGANEYLGELYLETGELESAQGRLDELAAACPSGCEEHSELAEAIAAYKSAHGLEE